MGLKCISDKFWRFGINFILFLSLFVSTSYAVTLTPGIDADITYSDSSKGIWWSELSIYAKTGISVGDIIEMPYNASNSTDYGLYPLMLKLKDNDIIICVNELLDNIAPYTSYPICFYNNDPNVPEYGFNYSVREAQSLFTSKSYDVVWGKKDRVEDFSNYGIDFINYTYLEPNHINTTDFNNLVVAGKISGSQSSVINNNSNTDLSIVYSNNYMLDFSQLVSGGEMALTCYHYYPTASCSVGMGVISTREWDSWGGNAYTHLDFNSNFLDNYIVGFYTYSTKNSYSSTLDARTYLYGSNNAYFTTTTWDTYQYSMMKFDSSSNYIRNYMTTNPGNGYFNSYKYLYNRGLINKETFDNFNFNFSENNRFCQYLAGDYIYQKNTTLSDVQTSYNTWGYSNNEKQIDEWGCENDQLVWNTKIDSPALSRVTRTYNKDISENLTARVINAHRVQKESDDTINGINLVPYTTNSAYPSFLTFEDGSSNTLWFDLNDFNSPVLTNDLDNYIVDGENYIKVDQVNNDGGFWMFFEGQYNTPPTLSPGPTLNVSGALELGESIYCNAGTYQDAESDPQSGIEFGWWKNNVKQAPTTQALNINTISAIKGDKVKCGQRVSDGNSQSSWYYSSELDVIGAKPTATLTLDPTFPGSGENVTCIASNLDDSDGDNVSVTLSWIEDSTTVVTTSGVFNMSGGNLTLDGSLINSDLGYECIGTLDDGTAQINISKSFGVGNVPPTMIRNLDLDTDYGYDDYLYSNIGCLADDVNGDTITYTYEYSNDKVNWSIAQTTTGSSFSWDSSSLSSGTYFLRCKASDGQSSSSYLDLPGNITIVDYSKTVQANTDNFYSSRFTISSGASILQDQYDSGSTGYLAGDLKTDDPVVLINYLPDKFDGVRELNSFEIKPNLAYVGGDSVASGTVKNYDILVYQVDTIGQIPTGSPLTAYYDTNLNIGVRNKFEFSGIVPGANKYIAIKVCRNVNEITNECNSDFNGLSDAIIVKGEGTGTYLSKVDQGTGVYSTVYNMDVKFDWEKEPLDKVKSYVSLTYADGMVPMVIVKRGDGDHVCGNSEVALKEGIPECIETISSSKYYILTENLENAVQYDILGGASIKFTTSGSKTLSVTKNSAMSSSVRMTLLGAEYQSSFTSSPALLFNSNSFWNVAGEFSTKVSSNPLNNVLVDGSNNLLFTSSSPGEILFWMEPIYSNLEVSHGTSLTPLENAQVKLPVSFTTNLNVDSSSSYCAFQKGGLIISKATILGSSGTYTCEPYLESTDEAGSYVLLVHVDDGTGYVDEYQASVAYSELKALSVDTIDFETLEYSATGDNRTLKAKALFKNTGNVNIDMIKIKARLDKFWDNDGLNSFDYEERLWFANLLTQLESARYRQEFLMSSENDVFFDLTELEPGDEQEVNFELQVPTGVSIEEYTTEWEVLYE